MSVTGLLLRRWATRLSETGLNDPLPPLDATGGGATKGAASDRTYTKWPSGKAGTHNYQFCHPGVGEPRKVQPPVALKINSSLGACQRVHLELLPIRRGSTCVAFDEITRLE